MARGKVKTGGKSRSKGKANRASSNKFAHSPYSSANDFAEARAFTLKDAARNSEHPGSYWSSSKTSLRHQTMKFVPSSDGLLNSEPEKRTEPPRLKADGRDTIETDDDDDGEGEGEGEGEDAGEDADEDHNIDLGSQDPSTIHRPVDNFAIGQNQDASTDSAVLPATNQDSVGSSPSAADLNFTPATSEPAAESPEHSSSDDEVVFAGRQRPIRVPTPVNLPPPPSKPLSVPALQTDDQSDFVPFESHSRSRSSRRRSRSRRSGGMPAPPRQPAETTASIAAALDDYAENMRINGEMEGLMVHDARDRDGWQSSDLQDFDDLATSIEILEEVSQVLSKRQRPTGVQYLVVWETQTVDEARWISVDSLPLSAAVLIESFEMAEEQKLRARELADKSSTSDKDSQDGEDDAWRTEDEDEEQGKSGDDDEDDDDDDNDEDEDDEDDLDDSIDEFEDELDLERRHKERLSDETIARLLEKQQALGIFSDELELFDGLEDFEMSDAPPKQSRSYRKKGQRRAGRSDRSLMQGMTTMLDEEGGDDYGDFDITDRSRPSVSFFTPNKKGKNSSKTYDLEDLELDLDPDDSDAYIAQLQAAWADDRRAKKAKKLEREELRAQGLLGKKNKNKPDLKARYNDGLSIDQMGQELESFLSDPTREQMSLPPMDKRDRKHMHDIASTFNLKSKSQGAGKSRFTILYKTSKTVDFDSDDFSRMRAALSRRFFSRIDKKGKGRAAGGFGGSSRRSGGGFGARADVAYREGETIGAAAPELGTENRGRAMLEKMGWSSGTALGALGSQGILTPISHVVRNTRAGLG